MPPSYFFFFMWLSSLISGIGAGINSIIGANTAKRSIAAQQRMNRENIAAQHRINAANVASQEKINQQSIDFQNRINTLMRNDAMHQHSNEVRDLKAAGLSAAAAGDKGGFSPAALSSPALTAPQQVAPVAASEMPDSAVSGLFNMANGVGSAITNVGNIANQIMSAKLNKAKAANQETENVYQERILDLSIKKLDADVSNIISSTELNDKKKEEIGENIKQIQETCKNLRVQWDLLDFQSKTQQERFNREMELAFKNITKAAAETDVADSIAALNRVKKEFEDIKVRYAKMGVNFDGAGLVDSLLRLLTSEQPADILRSLKTTLVEFFTEIFGQEPGDKRHTNIGQGVFPFQHFTR